METWEYFLHKKLITLSINRNTQYFLTLDIYSKDYTILISSNYSDSGNFKIGTTSSKFAKMPDIKSDSMQLSKSGWIQTMNYEAESSLQYTIEEFLRPRSWKFLAQVSKYNAKNAPIFPFKTILWHLAYALPLWGERKWLSHVLFMLWSARVLKM